MSQELLFRALEAVETARESATSSEMRERLDKLASHLESQAERETTPALGTLDRVQTKLGEIEADTDAQTVADALEEARENILSFLGTLDDRGMKQH